MSISHEDLCTWVICMAIIPFKTPHIVDVVIIYIYIYNQNFTIAREQSSTVEYFGTNKTRPGISIQTIQNTGYPFAHLLSDISSVFKITP
jgi:hypothetical protein